MTGSPSAPNAVRRQGQSPAKTSNAHECTMSTRDDEIAEQYEDENDLTKGAQLLDARGEIISADSIRARMSADNQRAVDAKLEAWFGNETEHAAYDLESVRELYRNAR